MTMRMIAIAFLTSHFALLSTQPTAAYGSERQQVHTVKYSDDGEGNRQFISDGSEQSAWILEDTSVVESSYPQYIVEHQPLGIERIVVLKSKSRAKLQELLRTRGVVNDNQADTHDMDIERVELLDDVVTLVDSGPSENRIDLVFMGDGYTEDERQTFFQDIQRMVDDMFSGDTFRSYLPLFNVHAVFRPSNESGIGRNDRPKDTAYGLYRSGNTLRAIYPSKAPAARQSCRAAPGCDYPVIIANDPYYGGLGGEFAISTNSTTSGTMVLRHELGHNFGRVGEEYDGGGYFGANHSSSLNSLKWEHWATNAEVRAEPSTSRLLAWPWHNLSTGPYEARFQSDGRYSYTSIRLSASGFATGDTLAMTLDGEPLSLTSPGHGDRAFQDLFYENGLANGRHTLRITEMVSDGDNWVSSVNLQEYGEDYHFDPDFIGAFPLFGRMGNVAGYRATHESCLMRNMNSTAFCPICQENNWLQFFTKVRLIDRLEVNRLDQNVEVTLRSQALGQLHPDPDRSGASSLIIRWFKNGVEDVELRNLRSWNKAARDAMGEWRVDVEYATPEVRRDQNQLLKDSATREI